MTRAELFASDVEASFKFEMDTLHWKAQSRIMDYTTRKKLKTKEEVEEYLYKYFENKQVASFEEIAEALHLPAGQVRRIYAKAIAKLQIICQGREELRSYIK